MHSQNLQICPTKCQGNVFSFGNMTFRNQQSYCRKLASHFQISFTDYICALQILTLRLCIILQISRDVRPLCSCSSDHLFNSHLGFPLHIFNKCSKGMPQIYTYPLKHYQPKSLKCEALTLVIEFMHAEHVRNTSLRKRFCLYQVSAR